ncbi:fam-a protein [Plasmodium ovale]|uniref:Fam-a protein n=2 Tax=Plasmodium ovale TaxID=36330 RepID=A0A1A8WV90_PLAOA|nr:fam-a protein [Plasmodium ovale curtisi]SBS96847.1 fam-a protein [Plasmodium ovale curtisi]SCP05647.1 fam-a protein [Plasmodium ovale]
MSSNIVNEEMSIEERLKKMKHLVCNNKEEIKKVKEIIEEAGNLLYKFSVSDGDYSIYSSLDEDSHLYFKKVNNVDVGKLNLVFHDVSKFEKLIRVIWDENGTKNFDPNFIGGKILRIYDKDLILLQQSYKGTLGNEGRYFYILAHKKKLNKDTYQIACVSLNINDNNTKSKSTFKNPFVSSANSFSLDIECDEEIKNSSLKKMYINLSGYHIKREDTCLNFTYVSSIDLDTSPLIPQFIIRKIKASKMTQLQALKNNL